MIERISFGQTTTEPKGWGAEVIIVNNCVQKGEDFPTGYSGKLLVYDNVGAKSSLHYHTVKHETFIVLIGSFKITYFNPDTAECFEKVIERGDVVHIPPHNPHQLESLEEKSTIIEFASADHHWDNYRIGAGDSQKQV